MRSRMIVAGALAAAVVIVAIVAIGGGSGGHRLRAVFESSEQLAPGQELRIAGRKVGRVGSIELADGHAIVDLNVNDGAVWPLPAGTTAAIRWGSTTSLAYRYVELHPGKASAPALPNNAILPLSQTKTAVELDTSYRIFRGRTRGDLKAVVTEAGETLNHQGKTLARGLHAAPGGLDETAQLLGQLSADRHALDTLVVSGDRVTSALDQREGDLQKLFENTAATFDEFARHTAAERASLDRAPRAFTTATGTLRKLNTSLVGLRALTDDLAPGAKSLRVLATPLHGAVAQLRAVVGPATSALRKGAAASPYLSNLLGEGSRFLPKLSNVLNQFEPMLACLRPYAPELAGMLSTWTGYNRNYDNGGHYARTFPLLANAALLPGTPLNSKQITDVFNGHLFYAMPRPPGLNAGKPWFQPQCDAGPDSLDPSKDPEGAGK